MEETSKEESDLKEKMLNGTADAESACLLLELLLNFLGCRTKVILKDKREIYGSLIYIDEDRMLLADCEEHYTGKNYAIFHHLSFHFVFIKK